MKPKIILLTIISTLTGIFLFIVTIECYLCVKNGCASDSKLIFFLSPIVLITIGIIRMVISQKTDLNFIYRVQEIIYSILLFPLTFVNSTDLSMTLGIIISIISFSAIILFGVNAIKKRKQLIDSW